MEEGETLVNRPPPQVLNDEETLVVAQANNKEVRLIPLDNSIPSVVVLNLTQPVRLGRQGGNATHPNFHGFNSKVVSRNHVDIWENDGKVRFLDYIHFIHSKKKKTTLFKLNNL